MDPSTETSTQAATAPPPDAFAAPPPPRKRRRAGKWLLGIVLFLATLAVVGRLMMPWAVTGYVNRVIDRSPLYDGQIGGVEIHLYRGAYSIRDVRINKLTGNVPVPLFAAKRVDLAIEWAAILEGSVVGTVRMEQPELNFVDGGDDGGGQGGDGSGQSGAGGPWLAILRDLFPFKINSVNIGDGSVHFRTYQKQVPIDVYLSQLNASVDNLTNVQDSSTPLVTTVKATALAMDQAKFEYAMSLDPFSYKPTFEMKMLLVNLDVTKVNALARGYGAFDFEKGWFDLVVEVESKEGQLRGYVKPLFRNLQVLDLRKDLQDDNVIQVFWEALVGGAQFVLKNQPRDQFGTLIPFTGETDSPKTDVLSTVGNVLYNAFVRAYLPRLDQTGGYGDGSGIEFGAAEPIDLSTNDLVTEEKK